MTDHLDYNGDSRIDVHDSYALAQNQQAFNSGESLKSIVGDTPTDTTSPEIYAFDSSGDPREYLFHKPTNLRDDAPLVVVCHGHTGTAASIRSFSAMNEFADSLGFAVCYPQGKLNIVGDAYWMANQTGWTNQGISEDQDIKFIEDLVIHLRERYTLGDAFQTGFSAGGYLSYYIARRGITSNVFKAFTSVPGVDLNQNITPEAPKYPILEIHGTSDDVVGYYGTTFWGGSPSVEDTFDYWCNNNMTNGTVTEEDIPDTDGSPDYGLSFNYLGSVVLELKDTGTSFAFPTGIPQDGPFMFPDAVEIAFTEPIFADQPLTNPSAVAGKIAVVSRGECSFTLKIRHCQEAGAVGVIIGNNDPTNSLDIISHTPEDDPQGIVSIPTIAINYDEQVELFTTMEQNNILPMTMNTTGQVSDGSTVVTYKCSEGVDSKEVWLYKIVGGGHEWPDIGGWGNNEIDATEEAIKFFDKFNTKTPFNMANMARASHKRKTDVSLKQRRHEAFAEYKSRLLSALSKLE